LALNDTLSTVFAVHFRWWFVEGAIYDIKIVSRFNNLVLAVKDGNKNPGALVEMQRNRTGDDSQLWRITDLHQIKSKVNRFCLTLEGNINAVFR